MKQQVRIAILMTAATTVIFGLLYPLAVTGLAQWLWPRQANGSLVERSGNIVGSDLLGQGFSSPGYFHPRPSAAGDGYDASNSGGTNLAATNHTLIDRANADAARLLENRSATEKEAGVPIDLVTTSASGLDPDITPASAEFQVARVAQARGMSEATVRSLVAKYTKARQFGLFGEPRVNVLELNLALDATQGRQ
ncbi:MAG TPA: potassium-transporting ATPase subunit KdpC [Candidatus Acidoferrales bacterium]|nr:potassium-transporting ATPase subunit KdpC [Candidatus Acidoferrales bacterium]